MKSKMRIILAVVLAAAFFIAVYAEPALPEDGSPDGTARVRPPHPCAIASNLRLQWESELQQQDELYDILEDLEEELDRLNRIIWDWHTEHSWDLSSIPCPVGSSECVLNHLDSLAETAREKGDTKRAAKLEEFADELRSLCAERDEFRNEQYNPAENRYEEARSQAEATEESYRRAQRECNLTRVSRNGSDLWGIARRRDRVLVDQMQNPMGSAERQLGNYSDSLSSETVLGQGPGPQFEATIGTLPQMRLFRKLPENQSTDNDQLSSSVTAVVVLPEQPENANGGKDVIGRTPMLAPPDPETNTTIEAAASDRLFESVSNVLRAQVGQSDSSAASGTPQAQQSGNDNTRTNSFGYTHIPLWPNKGQSTPNVTPRKAFRAVTPIKRMLVIPGRSFKR